MMVVPAGFWLPALLGLAVVLTGLWAIVSNRTINLQAVGLVLVGLAFSGIPVIQSFKVDGTGIEVVVAKVDELADKIKDSNDALQAMAISTAANFEAINKAPSDEAVAPALQDNTKKILQSLKIFEETGTELDAFKKDLQILKAPTQ